MTNNIVSLLIALLLHVVLIGLLLFQFKTEQPKQPEVMRATLVNAAAVRNTSQKKSTVATPKPSVKKTLETQPKKQAKPPKAKIVESKKAPSPQKKVEPKKTQTKEKPKPKPKLREVKPVKQSAAAKRAEAKRKQLKQQKETELDIQKKKLQEIKSKAAEQKKKDDAQSEKRALAEKKRKAADEEKKRAEAKARAQAEAERRRKEDAMLSQINEESSGNDKRLIAMYTKIIQQKVTQNWNRPLDVNISQPPMVKIRLSANGTVISVNLSRSSNDVTYDRSVVNAVNKAARFPEIVELPVGVFNKHFKEFELRFRPRGG